MWKFRTRSGHYQQLPGDPPKQTSQLFKTFVDDVSTNVMKSATVANTAFFSHAKGLSTPDAESATLPDNSLYRHGQYRPPPPPPSSEKRRGCRRKIPVAAAVDHSALSDDHQSLCTPDEYLQLHVMPRLQFYQARLPTYQRMAGVWESLLMAASICGVVLSFFKEARWSPIPTSVTICITAYAEFHDTERKLVRYSEAVLRIDSVKMWWDSLPNVEKVSLACVTTLVSTCEDAFADEHEAWGSSSAEMDARSGRGRRTTATCTPSRRDRRWGKYNFSKSSLCRRGFLLRAGFTSELKYREITASLEQLQERCKSSSGMMRHALLLMGATQAFVLPVQSKLSRVQCKAVKTQPIEGMRPGTSGLRKRTKVWETTPNYVENFAQSIVEGWRDVAGFPAAGAGTMVIGGDGRYFNNEAMQLFLKVLAGNGVKTLVVPVGGVISTPGASALVRRMQADGAILMTASHNPGGPDADFGVKFNTGPDGAPAKEFLTEAVYEKSTSITEYKTVDGSVDIATVGSYTLGDSTVQVVDALDDYVAQLEECFDFAKLRTFVATKPALLFDAMHGAAGPAALRVFCEELEVPKSQLYRCDPRPDFGGCHPDPNLKWASELCRRASLNADGSPGAELGEQLKLGVAFDGDGDRNMVVGHKFFASPSDSLAVLAAQAKSIKWFSDRGGLAACARSMPTSRALDRVAQAQNIECFETPTGWKFFGNLMELKTPFLCGEESFGTGADHVREKDGLWAALAWMSVLADAEGGVGDVVKKHWQTYGRDLHCRHDYEEVSSEGAQAMMAHLAQYIGSKELPDPDLESVTSFSYVDPLDASSTDNQGMVLAFAGGGRCVFRLSGTGSAGATVRVYIERPLPSPSAADLDLVASEALEALADKGKTVARLHAFVEREGPSVIT